MERGEAGAIFHLKGERGWGRTFGKDQGRILPGELSAENVQDSGVWAGRKGRRVKILGIIWMLQQTLQAKRSDERRLLYSRKN